MDLKRCVSMTGLGTPFFFQHGLGAERSQAQSLLLGLPGIRLISMDSPGHGNSVLKNKEEVSFDNYADQIIVLANFLKIRGFIAGGISMGAGVALNIALRYKERVKGLVIVRPAWLDSPNPENLYFSKLLSKHMVDNSVEEFINNSAFKAQASLQPRAAEAVLRQLQSSHPETTALILDRMVSDCPFPSLSQLKQIGVPALILASEDDFLHPIEIAHELHRAIPGSEFREVPSRYVNEIEHRSRVVEEVANFIKVRSIA